MAILKHKPEPFWAVEPEAYKDGRTFYLSWSRERAFDEDVARFFHRLISDAGHAKVETVNDKEERKQKPTGLNTVELLRSASAALGKLPVLSSLLKISLCYGKQGTEK